MNAKGSPSTAPVDSSRRLYFLLTSSGAAASQWLAATLDRHPDICCTCGAWMPETDPGEVCDTTHSGINEVAQLHLENFLAPEAPPKPIDFLFDNLETRKAVRVYGNIHAETVTTYANKIRKHPLRRTVRVANVIRHPVSRTESKFNILTYDQKVSPPMSRAYEIQLEDRLSRFRPLAKAIADQIGDFLAHPVQRTFVNSLLDTVEGLEEFRSKGVSEGLVHFQIERIRSDREVLRELIRFITDGALDPGERYLDWALSEENLAGGRYRKEASALRPPLGPGGQWREWTEWQRRAFQAAMAVCGLHRPYEERGYDFSFVEPLPDPAFPGLGQILFTPPPPPPRVASPALFNQRV
jgi:hypothetical protein